MNKYTLCILLSLLLTANFAKAQELPTGSANDTPAADAPLDIIPMDTLPPTTAPETAATPEPSPTPTAEVTPAATPTETAKETPTESAPTTTVSTPKPKLRKKITSISQWTAGLSSLQWNEQLTVLKAGKTAYLPANYNGLAVGFAKETTFLHWGWNFGVLFGVGRAAGGGDDTGTGISYSQDKQAFSIIGLTPRVFWRLTNRVNVGASAFVYSRNIDWPSETAMNVESGRKMNTAVLADLNIKLLNQWDFYQGIAPLEAGATLWKIGINYRFR